MKLDAAPLSMNYRTSFFITFGLAATLLLAGCNVGDLDISNRTPATLAENHSNVYTISVSVKPRTAHVLTGSIRTNIVIDGQTFPMQQSHLSPDLFEFDYNLPAGRQDATYYLLADYEVDIRGFVKRREQYSTIQSFKLANRFAYSLDVTRAPVGARVGVIGRGFKRTDTITIGGVAAPTSFSSPNSIYFHVPSLRPGQSYMVQMSDGESILNVGTLRVDAGTVTVSPSSLTLDSGGRSMLVFSVNAVAPEGGLFIDVTTDAPESIVMPEVVIPPGARSVNVPVQGGRAGRGTLFVEMDGYNSVSVPVTVR
jgi:hypothetical protein